MKKLLCGVLTVLLVLSMVVPAFAGNPNVLLQDMELAVESLVNAGKAKGAVLTIVQDGQVQLCRGFGYADENLNILADGEKTAFRIGSVSKTFVAVAAQILCAEGWLEMDRDISDYLEPDFPTLRWPVTMHQLLTHTAGFEDRVTGMAVMNVSDTEPLSESVRKYMPDQVFKPGTTTAYSNYGIALAAYVMERITGTDFSQYCRDQIFLPLGMTRTTYEHMHDIAYVSKPYLPDGRETLEPYMNLYPEGSAVSTADDIAKFILWLLDEQDTRVLQSKEALFARQFSMADELEGMGYIWNRKKANGKIYFDKKGETLHFYSRIALYPEADTGVFLSFNTYVPEEEINKIMAIATEAVYGRVQNDTVSTGKVTFNIAGLYVNNWSSFRSPEKILRYLVPGKMLTITGSVTEGFRLGGHPMIPIGEDLYQTHLGMMKFMQKDGKTIIAAEGASSFVRVSFWQSTLIQAISVLLFPLMALVCFIWEQLLKLSRKKPCPKLLQILTALQLILFTSLCLLMIRGIGSYSLLSYAPLLKLCGWVILAECAAGLGYCIYLKANSRDVKPLHWVWNLSGVLFCAWMVFMRIL